MVLEGGAAPVDGPFDRLPDRLRAGDLLVVNDAATLPASFRARDPRDHRFELRLLARTAAHRSLAVAYADGDWRTRTEHRMTARLKVGDRLRLEGDSMAARVLSRSPLSEAWIEIEFTDEKGAPADLARVLEALYRAGKPIQYSHAAVDFDLGDVQTAYASRPWAYEMPSAGRPFRWSVLLELMRRGVRVAPLTHAAGVSSTGIAAIDARLPLPERYEIPAETARRIGETKERGGRVIAIGTSVTRALEGSAGPGGRVRAGPGETDLILHPAFKRRVVDGILSGMHESTETHYRLLGSFYPKEALDDLLRRADEAGYLTHEFGDSCLLIP